MTKKAHSINFKFYDQKYYIANVYDIEGNKLDKYYGDDAKFKEQQEQDQFIKETINEILNNGIILNENTNIIVNDEHYTTLGKLKSL